MLATRPLHTPCSRAPAPAPGTARHPPKRAGSVWPALHRSLLSSDLKSRKRDMPYLTEVTRRRARLLMLATLAAAVTMFAVLASPAHANGPPYELFGDAELVHPGNGTA